MIMAYSMNMPAGKLGALNHSPHACFHPAWLINTLISYISGLIYLYGW